MLPSRPGHSPRLSAFYSAYFLFIGVFMPFFPRWLELRGVDAVAIGIIAGAPLILRVPATFAFGVSADAIGDRRLVAIGLVAAAMASAIALSWAEGFWHLLGATALLAIATGALVPLSDAITLGDAKIPPDAYGRVRLWGSVTFIAGNIACGAAISMFGAEYLIIWASCALLLALAASTALPASARAREKFSHSLKRHLAQAVELARNRVFILMIMAYGLIQAAHGFYYVFSVIHWRGLGMSAAMAGALWALAVVAEVILFAFAARLNRLFSATGLLALGAAAGAIRWAATAFDPPLMVLAMLQCGHAFSFAAAHMGAMRFIVNAVPAHLAASAQGLLYAMGTGLMSGLVILSSGTLYAWLGGYGYLVMAGLSAAAFVLAVLLARRWNGGYVLTNGPASAAR